MERSTPFIEAAYHDLGPGSLRSAETVVPVVMNLVKPSSVVDFGCGTGAWLSVFAKHGCVIRGVEAGASSTQLLVPAESVTWADLEAPIDLDERFDLAMSVEVAEHLPADYANQFVETLTRHADTVLFSAAIPGQGGTHHINEQWPDYWATKFAAQGYGCVDVLRDQLWNDESVEWWYRQNILIFTTQSTSQPGAPRRLVRHELYERLRADLAHETTTGARARGVVHALKQSLKPNSRQ